MTGTFYAIGVGPGDPDLLTLKAFRYLQSGAIIAYPIGADSGTSLARKIAAPHIPDDTEEFGFAVPMRVERDPAQQAYRSAAETLADYLTSGRDVVLLCEGDPLFYGSAMFLTKRLAKDFPVEIVPGITSLTASAAAAKHPLAARNDKLKVLPAPLDEDVLEREIKGSETIAIIKVGRHFEKVRTVLDRLKLINHAVIVEHATDEKEKITPLRQMSKGERPYFSTILIYQGDEDWGYHG